MMAARPRRTHDTDLPDDALMLMDAMFDDEVSARGLRRDNYRVFFNLPWTHNLDDDALAAMLRDLLAAGLIHEAYPGAYGLSGRGAQLWEAERLPLWEQYVAEDSWPDEHDPTGEQWLLSVKSPSLEIVEAFLETAYDCQLYVLDADTMTMQTHENDQLLLWKTFPRTYEISIATTEQQSDATDWALYHARRTWWGDVFELASLHE